MIEFENIEFLSGLFILIPLVLLFFYVIKWKQSAKKKLGDARLVDLLTKDYSPQRYRFKIIIVLFAIGLGIVENHYK